MVSIYLKNNTIKMNFVDNGEEITIKVAPLEGSEKQVKWANDIRKDLIYAWAAHVIEPNYKPLVEDGKTKGLNTMQDIINYAIKMGGPIATVANETSAKRLIDAKTKKYVYSCDDYARKMR